MADLEEVKGQPINLMPKVHTMKACIVSMEYKTKNNDGKKEVATLAESYKDAEKVKQLFEKTLGWH
jgi:hypothetical protein